MNQQTCNRDRLDAFLKNDLSQREEQMLTSHLDECSDCREELESRAAEQSVWREASNLLGGSIPLSTAAIGDSLSGTVHSPQIALVLQQLAPTDDPESLGRIGGYEVTGVVGAGGMGVVLKAHDRSLDRIVAIKVMAPHLASSGSARKRFAREAKAAAAVLHPNVIAIHSVASEDANPYLVMPFVRGASLQKRIDSQGPLPLKDALRIGAQIAAGLAAAHEQGLVHRDIKPANILLEEGVERVTITDFGLARAVDDASMTCSGVIAGTPQYMSPEQARGEPIDARSDLFSLGGVLYAMCTGRSPFRAETTYGVLHRIANDKPTPVCEVNTDVPVWLGQVIERLMAKRPEDRFKSAAQVAELLEGCLAHVQQPAAMPLPAIVEQLSQLLRVSSTASQPAKKQLRQLFYNLPPIGKFMAAAVGACALLFAGVLIVLELGKGTLTIESELDNVPIRIMQGDKVVDRLTVTKSGNSVRVAAGMYVVELDAKLDGIVVENESISLKRGDNEQIRIRYAKPLANSSEGSTPDKFSQSLQGEWEYVSVETDGVTTEYKTLEARLKIAGDRWTVPIGDGITVFGSGHRVEVDGSKLTFHMPGLGSNEDIPSICYGLFEVDGDALTYLMTPYLMTPAVAEGALSGQGQPPIKFPDSFETKNTENIVYRLRRIQASTPPTPSSSTNQTQSKSSPEFSPVKISVHDEEGKPLEGVKVSLIQLAKDQGGQVLEINETSNVSGMAVNRNLPYGHYELSATTADGWYLTGARSRLNVEFEKGVDATLVAPTPGKTSKLVISPDIMASPEKISGLRFGGLTEDRWTQHVPEPEGSDSFKEKEFSSFPTITNGIEYVGAEIGLQVTRNISQPAPSMQQMNTSWIWSRPPNSKVSFRYLIANGQARGFHKYDEEGYTAQDVSLKLPPVDGSEFFKLPGVNHQVGATLLKLREPTQLPLELDIPAGNLRVRIGRFLGKPSAAVMATLNWQPQEQQPELWLQAYLAPDSAWVERLINIDWINSPFRSGGSVGFTALWRDQALQPGERLEIPLGMKHAPKTSLKTKASGEKAEPNVAQPALLPTDQVIDALVTFEFSGVSGNATLNTSGIGWVVDQRGHILVPSETAPRSEDYSIEVRYADGSRTSAKRVFTFGHLALLKPEKAPAIAPIKLNSQQAVQDGDQVLAILNGTDVQKGTVTSAKKTIVSLDSWPILYSPRLRFPNAIETDFKSDAATLFGAPLLTPSGEVVGMLLNYKPPLFAIPLSEIQIACREFESSQKQTPEAAVKAAQGAPTPGLNDESKAPAIDHRNARAVVEAYVASALAGDVAEAASLAKNSPADPKRIRELPEFLNVQRLKIETVYINDPAKPTRALATSVAVKLGEEHKTPDGRRDGFLVFTLEFTDEKWFVIDIDFETESGVEKELNKFLKTNPNSIGIPPRSEPE